MTGDNFRLAEHNVEMDLVDALHDGDQMIFKGQDSSYVMSQVKWVAAGEPQTIYITVTSVIKTAEPADGVEVHRSAETGEFVSEEFAERNPSTTMKHSFDVKDKPGPPQE